MRKYEHGDYVWVTRPGGVIIPAVIQKEDEADDQLNLRKSHKTDRLFVSFYHGKTDSECGHSQCVAESAIKPFQAAFAECASVYLKKGSVDVLEEIVKEMNWTEGEDLLQRLRLENPRGKHPRSDYCSCSVCKRSIGNTISCQICNHVYVHRKCGNVTGDMWVCGTCLQGKVEDMAMERRKSEPLTLSTNGFLLARAISEPVKSLISEDRLQLELVFDKIRDLAQMDEELYNIIAAKQREFHTIISEFEGKKGNLLRAKMSDQDYRMSYFRMQEVHSKSLSQLKMELSDQLQGAQVFGFESIKQLKKKSGNVSWDPTAKEQESYRDTQKRVIDKLLTTELRPQNISHFPSHSQTNHSHNRKQGLSLGSVLLNHKSENSVFPLLSRCINKVKNLKVTDELSLPLLSAIVKVTHDATFSNCSPSLLHFTGGGTDPRLLSELLIQVNHKY